MASVFNDYITKLTQIVSCNITPIKVLLLLLFILLIPLILMMICYSRLASTYRAARYRDPNSLVGYRARVVLLEAQVQDLANQIVTLRAEVSFMSEKKSTRVDPVPDADSTVDIQLSCR